MDVSLNQLSWTWMKEGAVTSESNMGVSRYCIGDQRRSDQSEQPAAG